MADTINAAVAAQLATLGSKVVEDAVVKIMVDRDVEKRTTALVNVLEQITTTKRDLNKIGPDNVTYDITGARVSETFSKARIDERYRTEQKLTKMRKAVDKALTSNDFGDVFNLSSGKEN